MRIRENHPLRSQLLHMRRLGLRVAFQCAGPVIQIINSDKQYIRLPVLLVNVLSFTGLAYHAQ
jgi:hypothetical protein